MPCVLYFTLLHFVIALRSACSSTSLRSVGSSNSLRSVSSATALRSVASATALRSVGCAPVLRSVGSSTAFQARLLPGVHWGDHEAPEELEPSLCGLLLLTCIEAIPVRELQGKGGWLHETVSESEAGFCLFFWKAQRAGYPI